MRRAYKRFIVFGGFTALLVVLVVNTIMTRRQLSILDKDQKWVDHTQQVLLELVTVESLIKDAETGQRGFLYTQEPRYLDPYTNAVATLDAHLNKLSDLTADNALEHARVPVLVRLVKQKQDELARTVALAQSGKQEQARAIVLSDLGRIAMDNIRAIVQEMRREENSLLAARLGEMAGGTSRLIRTIYIGRALGVIGLVLLAYYILREMNEREKHAADIRSREEWFRVTLGSIGDAVIATDEHGAVIFLNRIAEDLTGIELLAAQGKPVQAVFPIFNEVTTQPVDSPVAKVLQEGRIIGLANHTVLRRSDGKIIPIEDSAAPIYDDQRKPRGVVMVFRDVTGKKQLEEAMRKAEKLATASRLAASMAHEINNPLEAVCNLVYMARTSGDLSPETRGYLNMAEHELERVSHVTRQTLGFYRDPAGATAVDVRGVIESVTKLYANKLKDKNISVELQMDRCPPVRGLQGDLKQLVANLVGNAADAVSDGGKIRISACSAAHPEGEGVEIKVCDDGPGISAGSRTHLFEPFFTTKENTGTGLGLWVSKQIVERHQGTIEAGSGGENDLGGAVFTVFLRGMDKNSAVSVG